MTSVGALSRHQRLTGGMNRKDRKMSESAAQKRAREKREADAAAEAAAKGAPEPKDASNTENADSDVSGVANQSEVDAQRDAEGKGDGSDAPLGGTGTGDDGAEKPAAKDVADEKANPDQDGVATTAEAQAQREARGESVGTFSDVQSQRDAEADAAAKREGIRRGDLDSEGNAVERSEEEQALLDAAPGGQRTLLTGSAEGSTMVRDTAAYPSPASGPLHDPVNDITNLNARDDDPDNRVYGDEAGPRDVELTGKSVETQTRIVDGNGNAPETRFVGADGEGLSYEDIFDDNPGKTFVTTKVRVREQFVFPNSVEVGTRLAYVEGRRVPRAEAENIRRMIDGDDR